MSQDMRRLVAAGMVPDRAGQPAKVVAGEVNLAALEALVRLCAELGGHGPGRCQPRRTPGGRQPRRR